MIHKLPPEALRLILYHGLPPDSELGQSDCFKRAKEWPITFSHISARTRRVSLSSGHVWGYINSAPVHRIELFVRLARSGCTGLHISFSSFQAHSWDTTPLTAEEFIEAICMDAARWISLTVQEHPLLEGILTWMTPETALPSLVALHMNVVTNPSFERVFDRINLSSVRTVTCRRWDFLRSSWYTSFQNASTISIHPTTEDSKVVKDLRCNIHPSVCKTLRKLSLQGIQSGRVGARKFISNRFGSLTVLKFKFTRWHYAPELRWGILGFNAPNLKTLLITFTCGINQGDIQFLRSQFPQLTTFGLSNQSEKPEPLPFCIESILGFAPALSHLILHRVELRFRSWTAPIFQHLDEVTLYNCRGLSHPFFIDLMHRMLGSDPYSRKQGKLAICVPDEDNAEDGIRSLVKALPEGWSGRVEVLPKLKNPDSIYEELFESLW